MQVGADLVPFVLSEGVTLGASCLEMYERQG